MIDTNVNDQTTVGVEVVILEGPDCSGKTTLANQYTDLGYKYYHNGYDKNVDIVVQHTELIHDVLDDIFTHNQDVVVDRWFYSELVYGTIFRGQTYNGYCDDVIKTANLYLFNAVPVTTVMCLPPKHIWAVNFASTSDSHLYTDLERNAKVYDLYKFWFETGYFHDKFPNHDIVLYDYTHTK